MVSQKVQYKHKIPFSLLFLQVLNEKSIIPIVQQHLQMITGTTLIILSLIQTKIAKKVFNV